MRIKIIRLIIIGLFIVITLRMVYVQVIRGQHFRHLSTNNRIRVVPLEGVRGSIHDREGVALAKNKEAFNCMVTPQSILNGPELFSFIEGVLGEDDGVIAKRFERNKFTPFAPTIVAEDISKEQAMILEENIYRFPSLLVQLSYSRVYPTKKTSAHVLGYVGKINQAKLNRLKEYGFSQQRYIGYTGVEEFYDSYLKGGQGGIQVEVNNQGQQVRLLSIKEPGKGQDITLTIDHRLQEISAALLVGHTGSIVVMDTESGEILGLNSAPGFDPNVLVDKKYRRRKASLLASRQAPLLNRAIKGQFPPGSVFKVPVAICGLKSGKITEHTTFDCKGFYEIGGIRYGCTHVHGTQNLNESIAHSCNIYYYMLGKILGADLIHKTAKVLGLGQKTGIDLPYEARGLIPSRRKGFFPSRRWYTGDTLNMAIGQGDVLSTPLQLVSMMAIVANSGVAVNPHVIKSIGGKVVNDYSLNRKVPVDPQIFKTIQKALRAAVTDYAGTAHVLDLNGLHVAGKTGTAQSGRKSQDHAWFVGYAQTDKRKISFCVFLEHGGSSQNACLMAKRLLLDMKHEGLI